MSNLASNKAEAFLRENGLHADCFDFQTEVRRFMAEMDAGLCGGASTLQMAPTYLDTSADLPEDGDVVAVDAGGTNLRVALVRFRAGRPPEIVAKEKAPVPGSGIPVTLDEFFDRVVEQAGALLDEGDRLGMCFSFPSEILPDKDARILLFNKELRVAGAEGALIGPSLNAALARAGKGPRRVTVLNDTAAALLGELAMQQKRAYAGHIGLIYGTGLNYCYSEKRKGMLINTEAGGYGGFAQGVCDEALDRASVNPGDHRFEKMVSGVYFGPLALRVAKLAADAGLFTEAFAERVRARQDLSAADVSEFMRKFADGDAAARRDADRRMLFDLYDGLCDRAAKLVAIAVAAAMWQSGGCELEPVFLVAEGSSFKKGHRFRERFERMLAEGAGAGFAYDLVLAENHTLIGAAVATHL